ncbi:hypothetical protein L227DRAFT_299871 [Lentinus tigrinus ALCF2SS1-6]|uniref:Uncharacterized protein n=1 Tax=Lentinus tigrinus ALCF2SS1-6 TaxID=1328759 RepID=A0A5C2RXK1_9APHY|nr:hypothetical protein L227DRAFT_299871 [Lentinus tigrinus ALCF2SS1-6]
MRRAWHVYAGCNTDTGKCWNYEVRDRQGHSTRYSPSRWTLPHSFPSYISSLSLPALSMSSPRPATRAHSQLRSTCSKSRLVPLPTASVLLLFYGFVVLTATP